MSRMKDTWADARGIFGSVPVNVAGSAVGGSFTLVPIPHANIVVGDYMLWKAGDGEVGIGYQPTGEMGVFKSEDFESYIKAFFGLNF